ncbi:thioester domain-containing protein [Oscillospiraceae bacterium PP1C4]
MGMPIIKPSSTNREQSITDIIESVALEQTALSHILNAEGEKIQKSLEACSSIVITKENHLRLYDFVFEGVIPYLGLVEGGLQTAIFQLTDSISGLTTLTYCFDVETFIQVGDHYLQDILKGSTDISDVNANRIRSILFNAFPYISVATIIARSGIATLTQQEAITAAQLAIWHLTNNLTITIANPNVLQLYNWYLNLAPTDVIINPAQINLTAPATCSTGSCAVVFSFNTNGVNADNTPIALPYAFSKDIVSEYGAVITESSSGGTTNVQVTNLPQGANFSIIIIGVQSLPLDAYRYMDAQDLTGLFMQTNYMSAQADYLCKGNSSADIIKVNKSVETMVHSISLLEMVLQSKLALFGDCLCDK